MITLEKHTNKTELIHLTTEFRLKSILMNGIQASHFGDLEVNGNDGYGVYAVRSLALHADLIDELSWSNEPLYAITFTTPAEWYECVNETPPDDYDEDEEFIPLHIGYIVLPYNIDKQFIKDARLLATVSIRREQLVQYKEV